MKRNLPAPRNVKAHKRRDSPQTEENSVHTDCYICMEPLFPAGKRHAASCGVRSTSCGHGTHWSCFSDLIWAQGPLDVVALRQGGTCRLCRTYMGEADYVVLFSFAVTLLDNCVAQYNECGNSPFAGLVASVCRNITNEIGRVVRCRCTASHGVRDFGLYLSSLPMWYVKPLADGTCTYYLAKLIGVVADDGRQFTESDVSACRSVDEIELLCDENVREMIFWAWDMPAKAMWEAYREMGNVESKRSIAEAVAAVRPESIWDLDYYYPLMEDILDGTTSPVEEENEECADEEEKEDDEEAEDTEEGEDESTR
eukprot:GEMP01080611.1.p1 GENE.GEMP01080611.1~~GEMP01080611.1.p1  ORF type:complete len:336 (+),score=90.05 GEMP01080611.1:75-1010(+)